MKTSNPPAPPPASAKSTAENIKDTLESIVVAFILAFIFRAFIVEAFVIPTGSMATTLYGNQATNTCTTCGYEFARGIEQQTQDSPNVTSIRLRCPNCDTTPDSLDFPSIHNPDSGDRILVHKWPFDIGGKVLGPHRWEVTVFKDPADGTTNFIKRLVGLPGEVLEIIDGDVYTASLEPTKDHPGLNKVAPELVKEMEQLRLDVYQWGHPTPAGSPRPMEHLIVQRYEKITKDLQPYLRIHRKLLESPRAQESLWFNVYSHDFLPVYGPLAGTKLVGWYAEGAAATAWGTNAAGMISEREMHFKSTTKDTLYLRFGGKAITDFSAYNSEHNTDLPVGDVRIRFTWFPDAGGSPEAGPGALVLQMNRDQATFVAEIRTDGSAVVTHHHPDLTGGQQEIGRGEHLFEPAKAVEVEFMIVDYMARLVINGQPVIESNDRQYKPDVPRILAKRRGGNDYDVKPTEVRIGARAMDCRLRHVRLDRDEYYRDTTQTQDKNTYDPNPKIPVVSNAYINWAGWGTVGRPILLRNEHQANGKSWQGEYFMLGDNSAASKDSRLWWEIGPHLVPRGNEYQAGTVPGDQLIGQAFFVYWPAGYRCLTLKDTLFGRIGMIPNFGRMRWIR